MNINEARWIETEQAKGDNESKRILHAVWNLRQHEGAPGHTQRMSDYTSGYRRACDDIELAIRTLCGLD